MIHMSMGYKHSFSTHYIANLQVGGHATIKQVAVWVVIWRCHNTDVFSDFAFKLAANQSGAFQWYCVDFILIHWAWEVTVPALEVTM